MLSDRTYMRDEYSRHSTSVSTWLICAIIAGYVVQNIAARWLGPGMERSFNNLLALSGESMASFKVWTLISYSFLHSMSSFLHVVFNLLWIWLLGRELVPLLGNKRFLWLYGGGVVGGALLWLTVNYNDPNLLFGASAGVCALLMVYAAIHPNKSITLLLFFIVPVTIKPKWLVIFIGGFDLLGFLFYEAVGGVGIGNIAHSAHLGGFAVGWLFFRYVYQGDWQGLGGDRPAMELPAWMKRGREGSSRPYKVNVGGNNPTSTFSTKGDSSRHVDLKAEVDRILDKINTSGFGALTDEEKRILDRAKDMLNRR